MPDALLLLKSSAVSAILAALTVLAVGCPWRQPRPTWLFIGGALGVGAGFLAGAWSLGLAPRFPPLEDQDRLLFIVLPAVVAAEISAALLQQKLWLGWLLRLIVAIGATPVLLHGSIYLTDSAGPETRIWQPEQAALILGTLAAALLVNWVLLDRLASRTASPVFFLMLALANGGAGVAVILSGYSSGGQLALPLAAGLAGAALAAFVLSEVVDQRSSIGVGLVGLFSLLVIGRFFGSLTTMNAVLLFFAPLLGWLPELSFVSRVGPRLRNLARLLLAVVPVAVALTFTVQSFIAASRPPTTTPASIEASPSDYLNFSK